MPTLVGLPSGLFLDSQSPNRVHVSTWLVKLEIAAFFNHSVSPNQATLFNRHS
jgi:hypothetical protein